MAPIEWRWAASATRTHLAAVYQCSGCGYPGPHWGHRTYDGYRARTACGHGPTSKVRLWLARSTPEGHRVQAPTAPSLPPGRRRPDRGDGAVTGRGSQREPGRNDTTPLPPPSPRGRHGVTPRTNPKLEGKTSGRSRTATGPLLNRPERRKRDGDPVFSLEIVYRLRLTQSAKKCLGKTPGQSDFRGSERLKNTRLEREPPGQGHFYVTEGSDEP